MKIIRKLLLCLAVLMSVSFAQSMVTQAAETQDNVQFIKENEEVSGVHMGGSLHPNKYSFHVDENVKLKFEFSLAPGTTYHMHIYDEEEKMVDFCSFTVKGNEEFVDKEDITYKLDKGTYTISIHTFDYTDEHNFKFKYYKYGFVDDKDGKLRYFDENGMAKGWRELSPGGAYASGMYYFDENGYAVDGLQTIDNNLYYFWGYVAQARGWENIDNKMYYFTKDYYALNGWQDIEGETYYFRDYTLVDGYQLIDGDLYYFSDHRQVKYDHEFVRDYANDCIYYFIDGKAVNGLQDINGYLYYFKDFKGLNGFYNYNGGLYYFSEGGIFKDNWLDVDEGHFYFGDDYKAVNGWKNIMGKLYYFKDYKAVNGLQLIDGDYYYFAIDANVDYSKDAPYAQKGMVDEIGYIFADDYKAIKDSFVDMGYRYYYTDGYNYKNSEFKVIDGDTYYFDKDEHFAVNDWLNLDEKKYYFKDYKMVTGLYGIVNHYYNFASDGHLIGFAEGWGEIDGDWYYFINGRAATSCWVDGRYLDEYGVWNQAKGKGTWIHDGIGWWYEHSDLSYTTNNFEEINGQIYYFNGSGYMQTGWQFINKKWYYFNGSGAMLKNTWFGEYLLDENGVWQQGVFKVKWIQDSTGWWYRHSDGGYTSNNFEVIDGKTYYFNGSGYMQTGWQFIDKKWYYFEGSGAMLKDTWLGEYLLDENGVWQQGVFKVKWIQDSTGWWYRHSDGGYTKNNFEVIDGQTYYFNGSGYMQTGWQFINSKWYYFNGSGAMLKDTWFGEYLLDENGVWQQGVFKVKWIQDSTGWWYRHSDGGYTSNNFEVIDGKTYYFNGSGYMQTGWQFINSKWYYFNGSGAMLKNTYVDGYWLDENGVWK